MIPRPFLKRTAFTASLVAWATLLPGCNLFAPFAFLAKSYEDTVPQRVEAKTTLLKDKSFAVLVTAEPGVEVNAPRVGASVCDRVTQRLVDPIKYDVGPTFDDPKAREPIALEPTGATGYIEPRDVMKYLYNHPGWAAKRMSELGAELGGPDVLIVIELHEWRLNDPGNQYSWDGLASGDVTVFDLKGTVPDEPAFREAISVKFPDSMGVGPDKLQAGDISSVLLKRFVDRVSWLFYPHLELKHIKY